ncbi:MAG: hypothetical protein RSE37_23570, partial [Citrobacter sp.]
MSLRRMGLRSLWRKPATPEPDSPCALVLGSMPPVPDSAGRCYHGSHHASFFATPPARQPAAPALAGGKQSG